MDPKLILKLGRSTIAEDVALVQPGTVYDNQLAQQVFKFI